MRICRRTRRLHDENIGAAYVLFNLKIELAVGKSRCLRTSEIATQLVANLFRQRAIRIAGKDFDAAGGAHSVSDKLQLVASRVDKLKFVGHLKTGWGGRIRTYECRIQRPVPYHLATPQHHGPVKRSKIAPQGAIAL